MFDLMLMNPNASTLRPGATLTAPCYPAGKESEFDYYGGSVAFGQVRLLPCSLCGCSCCPTVPPGWQRIVQF